MIIKIWQYLSKAKLNKKNISLFSLCCLYKTISYSFALGFIACPFILITVNTLSANIDSISSGSFHNLIRKSNDSLMVMGANDFGQLGDATDTTRPNPINLGSIKVISHAAGEKHSAFVKTDGSAWAMGLNAEGQLGDLSIINRNSPVLVIDENVSHVICGWNHTLFLKNNQSLWSTGSNEFGQLGIDSLESQNSPQPVNEGTNVLSVAAGGHHTMFIKDDGSLWAVGRNNFGQLGNNTLSDTSSPIQIINEGVTSVSAGQFHTLITKSDGSLWAFGRNNSGQLGDGSLNDTSTPIKILDSGVAAISAGGEHSLFLRSDGSLWGMGFNGYGQLGDASNSDRNTPVEIISADVMLIATGKYHSIFLKSDGSLWSMGLNDFGQLGDGTVLNQNSPTEVNIYFATVNTLGGGTVSGGGQFAYGDIATFEASPSAGYNFGFWSGGISGENAIVDVSITGDLEVNATFVESFLDSDGDGLTDYFELVVFGSNPDLYDSDGDGFSDSEENQTGLDPNVSDANYRAYYVQEIGNAQTAGNNGGIAWITENRSNYDLNTSAEVQYELGYQQGYSDTLIWLKENNASLYYESEINSFSEQAAIDQTNQVKEQLSVGVSGLAHIQQYRDENSPHAENWYYQPGMGWLWTNRSIFPVVYFADPDESVGGRWIYSIKSEDLEDGSYYDFLTNGIIDSSYQSNQ